MKLSLAILLLISLVLTACGDDASTVAADGGDDPTAPDPTDASSTSVSLAGTWQLAGLSVDGAELTLPPSPLSITIADGTISGNAGCNNFSGSIDRTDDGALSISQLIQTEMACEHLEFEIAYTAALMRTERWEATPDELSFVTDDVRIAYAPLPVETSAPSPLIGTVWMLDTVYGPGEGPQRTAASVTAEAEIQAIFSAGTLTITSAPCSDVVVAVTVEEGNGGGSFMLRDGDGGYECTGSELDDANVIHDATMSAIRSATGYLIDGDRLTMLGAEGELIGFAAQP